MLVPLSFSETGKVLKELGSGDFFGEIGILSLSEGQNRYTVIIPNCEVALLG